MAPGPDQGLDDERGFGRRMRAAPPDSTLAWVLEVVGGAHVVTVDALPGGSSSAMHVVTVRDANDATQRVVLRRYVLAQVLAEDLDVAAQEARALEVVDRTAGPDAATRWASTRTVSTRTCLRS